MIEVLLAILHGVPRSKATSCPESIRIGYQKSREAYRECEPRREIRVRESVGIIEEIVSNFHGNSKSFESKFSRKVTIHGKIFIPLGGASGEKSGGMRPVIPGKFMMRLVCGPCEDAAFSIHFTNYAI